MEKKKHESNSSSSDSSESNSDTDASSSRENEKNVEKKSKTQRSSSYSDDSEYEARGDKRKDKLVKEESSKTEPKDKVKKNKYDDNIQKSKWDSPSENVSRQRDRKIDKDSNNRHHYSSRDRDNLKNSRKYFEKPRIERRNDHKPKYTRDEERDYRHDGYKDRERYNRRQNEGQYRSDRRRSRERSRSNDDNRRDKRRNFRDRANKKSKAEDSEVYEWGKKKNDEEKKPPGDKEKPNFGLSGKLTEDTNTYRGVVIKYSEPTEARKPRRRWRLYPFKGEKALPTLYIHRESAYLMGRDRKVVDFPLDHPSCSKQHAVLQYRLVPFTRENGTVGKRVRPYIIDLDSANATYINNKKIEPRKYVELLEKDVIKFGYSTREYVLLHENSKDEGLDDDVKQEDDEIAIKEEPQEQE